MSKQTTISSGQSLLDVVLQEAGTIAAVFDFADAAGLAITDLLRAGMVLEVPVSAVAQYDVVAFYAGRAYRVNTGATTPDPLPKIHDFNQIDFKPIDFN